MINFINSFRPNHPFFEKYGSGLELTYRINISHKRNIWFMWEAKYKRLTLSFGKLGA